jgi:hypothetical protein
VPALAQGPSARGITLLPREAYTTSQKASGGGKAGDKGPGLERASNYLSTVASDSLIAQ